VGAVGVSVVEVMRHLKREVDRVKADIKAQARRAAADAKTAKNESRLRRGTPRRRSGAAAGAAPTSPRAGGRLPVVSP
jgi:hypothetical protein